MMEKQEKIQIKDILKNLRLDAKVSQKQLADALGIGQATVCQWEKGTSKPTCDAIIALSGYYNVSADFILGIDDEDMGMSKMEEACLGLFSGLPDNQQELIVRLMRNLHGLL